MLFGKIVRKYWHVLTDLYLSNDIGGILFHEFSPFFTQLECSVLLSQVFWRENLQYDVSRRPNSLKIGTNFPANAIFPSLKLYPSCLKRVSSFLNKLINW